jgi:hypothetical protein
MMPAEPSTADTLKFEAQEVLDELESQPLIPFKLIALKVEWIGFDNYMIYFDDTRLPSILVSWVEGGGASFRDVFRAAILDRVSRM